MTIKDIALESGYGVGTVSRVLNNQPNVSETARKRIQEVVERNHFRLNSNAKHLKQQAGAGIAVVVRGTRNMLFTTIVERLLALIRAKGYVTFISYIDEDEDELEHALRVLRERHPLGILLLGRTEGNFQERFRQIGVPCVLLTNSAASLGFENLSSVATDDEAGAEAAIEYLIGLGHRKIGILGGRLGDSMTVNSRYRGARRALDRHGVPFDVEAQYEASRFSMESGYAAMERLLDRMDGITSVFAMADVTAIGAIRAIRDHGFRVPRDISVIGFDGIELGRYLTPQLATIRQNADRIADRGVELLHAQIARGSPAVHEIVPHLLIQGESVRDLRAP